MSLPLGVLRAAAAGLRTLAAPVAREQGRVSLSVFADAVSRVGPPAPRDDDTVI